LEEVFGFLGVDPNVKIEGTNEKHNGANRRRKREELFWEMVWSDLVTKKAILAAPRRLKDALDRFFSSSMEAKFEIEETGDTFCNLCLKMKSMNSSGGTKST
jgi:hypothetical protein